MDIQKNVDMLMQADQKDWHHYEIENKRLELIARLEKIKELEENPELLKQKINEDITRRLIEG